MEWVRGEMLGRGSFATVNLAAVRRKTAERGCTSPEIMAVKSCCLSDSGALMREKEILDELAGCPEIVSCHGHSFTVEPDGRRLYNIFLDYVPGGALSELCRGSAIVAGDLRRYARSILRGLRRVHAAGYVHCDVKPENILVAGSGAAKLADFGLAKLAGAAVGTGELRGTPLYMAPEAVGKGEYGPACDIWSFGCVVAEMAVGAPARRKRPGENPAALIFRIGSTGDSPEIPGELPEDGRDFLHRCFETDPNERWTAEMLLEHPFLAGAGEDDGAELTPSPRSVFGFPTWLSAASSGPSSSAGGSSSPLPETVERIRRLFAGTPEPDWDDSGDSLGERWITVRRAQQ